MLWRMPEMDAPRALVFRPLVKGNEALGTRLLPRRKAEHLHSEESVSEAASFQDKKWDHSSQQLFKLSREL